MADRNGDGFAALRGLRAEVPRVDPSAKARAWSRLERSIDDERAARRRRRSWRWGAVAASIAASATLTSVLVSQSTDRGDIQQPLIRLAAVAAAQPPPSIPPGSFAYTRARVEVARSSTDIATGETGTAIVGIIRETWVASDGSGSVVESPIDRGSGEPETTTAKPGTLRLVALDRFPTDAEGLLEAIVGAGYLDEPDDDVELLAGVAALLRDSYASPAHRTALFDIVAGIDDVVVQERYPDPAGRMGTAVTLHRGGRSVTLVFEPSTSRLLAEREDRAGETVFEAAYLETGVVDELGGRPG